MLAAPLALLIASARALNIVLSNDDGWAVANIRAAYQTLADAGHSVRPCTVVRRGADEAQVVLSAPADNNSGRSSLDAPPTPLTGPCEFDSCPAGAPAVGADPGNRAS